MNYAGKFGSGGLDSASSTHIDLDQLSHRGHADAVTIPDAHLLFSGDFHKSGSDLVISDDLHRVVVPNYFHSDKRPTLVSPNGAPLDAKVIEALSGHTEYAQAGDPPAAKVIGHVAKMTGSASIVRNGVTVVLNNGDAVYQSDVVQTGSNSTLGLVLSDGTTFNLSAGARLMLNDLTYDASSTSNSALFTLVQGAASFVAGQVARTGDMKVGTPVATMGIRGTAVVLDINAADGTVSISVVDQHDGQVHAVQVFNARGDLIGTVTSNGTTLTLTPTATFEVIARESNKTPAQIALEFSAFQAALDTYNVQKAIDPSLPQHTENGGGNNANPQTTKFAGSSTPAASTGTEFHEPAAGSRATGDGGTDTHIIVTASSAPSGAATGAGLSPPPPPSDTPTAPIVVFDQVVQVVSIPFPVTPLTVSPITSGAGDHSGPVMSASGNVVYDPDGIVYFYDRDTGLTTRVSADDGLVYSGQTISSDGRYVVYQGSDGTHSWVFVWGTDSADQAHYHKQTLLVAGGTPAVSGDGSTILVEQGGSIGIFDLQGHSKGTITAVSIGTTGTLWRPSISADGHVIAVWNSDSASAGGPGRLYTYNLSTGVVSEIASTSTGAGLTAASISADGHYVVYQGATADGHSEIYLYDLVAGHVVFSTDTGGTSRNPVISPDGHFIIFTSDGQLVAGDHNAFADTYVVDVTDPANPHYKLISVDGNAASDGGVAISAGGLYVAFGSKASFAGGSSGNSNSNIFFADPSSGHSAIIQETASSPDTLTATGLIAVTGGVDGVTLSVTDQSGNPTGLLTASFVGDNIRWNFSEAKSHFESLHYGQDSSQTFIITLTFTGGSFTVPVTVTVHDAIQPVVTAVDVAPVAIPVTLSPGQEDNSYTLTPAALLAGVADIDGPSLSITDVTIKSGGGSIVQNGNGNWVYTPAADYHGPVVFNYTASDGTLRASSTATLSLAAVNDAPAIQSAVITMSEGDTVLLGPANIVITDADDSSFTFKVTNVTHGQFQVLVSGTWYNTATFTSAELAAGQIRFIHDGGEAAATFSIQADDGETLNHRSNVLDGTVNFSNVNDAPVITAALLVVGRGSTVVLGASNFDLTHTSSITDFSNFETRPDLPAFAGSSVTFLLSDVVLISPLDSIIGVNDPDSSNFTFAVSNVTHGVFQTTADGDIWVDATAFTMADLDAGHVRFVREDSSFEPTFSIQANDGSASNGLSGVFAGSVVDPIVVIVNTPPVITAASLAVSEGGTVLLAPADIAVTDAENSSFTFAVTNVAHGTFQTTADGETWIDAVSFTTADLDVGHVRFVHDGGETAPTFSIQANDGGGFDSSSNVFTGSVSFSNVNDAPAVIFASLAVLQGGTALFSVLVSDPDSSNFTFTVTNVSHGTFQATDDGVNWVDTTTFSSAEVSTGHVRFAHDGSAAAPTFSVQADDGAPVNSLSNIFVGSVGFVHGLPGVIYGDVHDNTLTGTAGNDIFQGFDGDDTINGLGGIDRAVYTDATGGITIDLAAGTVSGTGVGTDTLVGIETIRGSYFNDHYSAVGFTGDSGVPGVPAGFNSFEGMVGNDVITGNGQTQIVYASATGGVIVDMAAGEADDKGDGGTSIGHDTFSGVNSVVGGNFADHYIAIGFSGFNEFQGGDGDDTIDGNGNTRISYSAAFAGVLVDFDAEFGGIGVAHSLGTDAQIGVDTFRFVNAVVGSNFGDQLFGSGGALGAVADNNLNGLGGDDLLDGRGGNDILIGGTGADIFVYADGYGTTTIADFSHGDHDRIDLTGVSGVYSLGDVQAIAHPANGGADTLIDFGGGNTLMLTGVSVSSLAAGDFVFSPAPNRPATITGQSSASLVEDLNTFTSGTLTVHDVDSGEDHFQSVSPTALIGHYGTFTFNASGAWTYSLDHDKTDSLASNDRVQDTLLVVSADGTASQNIIITVTGTNDAPVFAGHDLASTYQATGDAVALVSNVSAGDIDSVNYAGGSLTATVTDGGGEGDTLSIVDSDFISVVSNGGSIVMFDADGVGGQDGVAIGTLTYNAANSLTVNLNASASDAAVAALTEAIEFSNGKSDTDAGIRTVTFSLQDGGGTANGGHDTDFFTATVDVSRPNQPATIDGDATGSVVEDYVEVTTGGTVAHDVDSGILTVHDVDSGQNHFQAVDPAALIGNYGTFTFDENSGEWTYGLDHGKADSLAADRIVHDRLTVTSADGTASQDICITIAGTNDAPVITGTDLAPTYTANGAAVSLVAGFSATDIDNANFNGGSLSATVTDSSDGDTLSIANSAFIFVDSGSHVMFDADGFDGADAVEIGTISDNLDSLSIDLNANATGAAVDALAQAIQFENVNADATAGTRHVTFTLNDGGGTANGGRDTATFDATVTVESGGSVPDINLDTISEVGIDPGLGAVGSGLPGTASTGLNDAVVTGVSTDGINFTSGIVHGTYFDFSATADGSYLLNVGNGAYPDASSLIDAVEANEGNAAPLADTFYYQVMDSPGHYVVDRVSYSLGDLTFDTFGPQVLGATHGQPYSLASLAVHDWGIARGFDASPLSVTVSVGFGMLSLNGSAVGGSIVNFAPDGRSVTIGGTQDQINADLDILQFTAPAAGRTDIGIRGVDGPSATPTYFAGTIAVDDRAPTATGDMSIVTVKDGAEVVLTTADLGATDPDSAPGDIIFTVENVNHGRLAFGDDRLLIDTGNTFTLADVQAGRVFYQSVGGYTGQDIVTLSLSDNVAGTASSVVQLGATIVDAQFTVLTADGYDFQSDDPIAKMGSGSVEWSAADPDHSFRIVNIDANTDFLVTGTGFTYGDEYVPTGGTITFIQEVRHADQASIASFALNVYAPEWYNATVAASHGYQGPIEALTSNWTFNFIGNAGADAFAAADDNDIFTGRAGNDTLDGQFGYDRANYGGATGAIDVQLAAGIVTGTDADFSGVGTDTLRSIEMVTGGNYDDTFDATGFGTSSPNAGSAVTNNVDGLFNEFEGRGGTDTITGNGQTRISYYHATSGVTVTFDAHSWDPGYNPNGGASGSATGDVSVGTDHFTGVNQVRGSFFDDVFTGSTNPLGTAENFEGLGGDDQIDGGGGFDRAIYSRAADDTGIQVDLAAGIVTGGTDTGTDTLRSVEGIWGTDFDDHYDASGFSTSSTNAGSTQISTSNPAPSNFNEFEGGGGDDEVIGNGNTRVAFYHSTGGVVVTLGSNGSGDAFGNDSVGHDTFDSGVTRVRGSEFNDIIIGNGGNNNLEGQGGNDVLRGMSGDDALTGGSGADLFVYDRFGNGSTGNGTGTGGIDTITDFHGHASEGDRIDLRSLNNLTSFSQITSNAVETGSGATLKTTIKFGNDITTELVLTGVHASDLNASDFIFHIASGSSVAVAVQSPDGYDLSTLYDDLAASDPLQAANDDNHIFAVDAARGITFELIGTGLAYDPGSGLFGDGTVTEIDILNTTDPTETTQDHVLVNTNGWIIDPNALFSAAAAYRADHSQTSGLNAIFNAPTYSIVGSSGSAGNDGNPHDGADVLFGGDHADVFNGMPGPFGPTDPGNDTVDYSHATGPVSVNLFTGATSGTAAAGDIFISIENLRGTDFSDALTGNGNNNTLEGGLGTNTLDGGGGFDVASYEHATSAVNVSLAASGPQSTGGAGTDTLTNIEGLRGSNFNDTLTGDGGSVLEGGDGDDDLIGQAGQANVTASYQHAAGSVSVDLSITGPQYTRGAGTDTLTNIANLSGSHFNDVLTGDTHDNILFGNGGHDVFVFNVTSGGIGHDTIGDFVSGADHIGLDYAAFDPTDPSSFNNWYASHVTTVNNGSDLLIDFDVSDPNIDTILLKNAAAGGLHANDFILHPGGGGF